MSLRKKSFRRGRRGLLGDLSHLEEVEVNRSPGSPRKGTLLCSTRHGTAPNLFQVPFLVLHQEGLSPSNDVEKHHWFPAVGDPAEVRGLSGRRPRPALSTPRQGERSGAAVAVTYSALERRGAV